MIDEAEYFGRLAECDGRDGLIHARATLQRALAELEQYIDRYDSADQLKEKADIINWALNHLATYIPSNVRLDVMAGAQAKLMRADVMK